MEKTASEIFREALSLPPEARAALADSLLESLDTEVDAGAEQAWREELQRRASELDSGAVQPIDWSEAHTRLKEQLKR